MKQRAPISHRKAYESINFAGKSKYILSAECNGMCKSLLNLVWRLKGKISKNNYNYSDFPGDSEGKESVNLPIIQETWVQSLGWEDPWRREWQPTPIFLPGQSHGQRSLADYSPWGCKESDTTDNWHTLSHTVICKWMSKIKRYKLRHQKQNVLTKGVQM